MFYSYLRLQESVLDALYALQMIEHIPTLLVSSKWILFKIRMFLHEKILNFTSTKNSLASFSFWVDSNFWIILDPSVKRNCIMDVVLVKTENWHLVKGVF